VVEATAASPGAIEFHELAVDRQETCDDSFEELVGEFLTKVIG
jgi:hypothetical protein